MINEFDYYEICNRYKANTDYLKEQLALWEIEENWTDFLDDWDDGLDDFYNKHFKNNKIKLQVIDNNFDEKIYTFNNYEDFVFFHMGFFIKMDFITYGLYTIYTDKIYLTLKNEDKTLKININILEDN